MSALLRMTGALLAVGLAAAAIGCGSSDDGEDGGAAAVTAAAAAKTSTAQERSAPVKTPVAINFTMQPVFAPLAWGKSKGIFDEAGFDVEIMPTQGSDQAMTFLNTGKVDYAVLDFDTYATQAVQGKTDARAVMVWLDRSSLALASTEPLDGPESLQGKSFGTTGFSAGRRIIPYVLRDNGVAPDSVRVEALDFSVLYPSLFQGSIDTAEIHSPGSWRNLLVAANRQNRRVHLTPLSEWGYDGYEKALIASARALEDPEAVRRFVDAAYETLTSAIADATDDEIYDEVKEHQPSSERQAIVDDWNDFKNLLGTPGPLDRAEVEKSLERLRAFGAITRSPDPDSLYDNQYLGER